MDELRRLLANNREWAAQVTAADPDFFTSRARQQAPRYLWVGCSDSRVPSNTVVGLKPGDLFVHRNIGNLVVHTDLNAMSVLQFAVEVLKVRHVIVCGHYRCGAVRAAMGNTSLRDPSRAGSQNQTKTLSGDTMPARIVHPASGKAHSERTPGWR